jgi:peroxiredoxin
MAAQSDPLNPGALAPDFALPCVDGKLWSRDRCRGPSGLLVMFICNHCPYVQAVIDRIVRDAHDLAPLGVGVVAISPNDPIAYPQDSFDHMVEMARGHAFPFPYLYDETQGIARAYGAVCTPDFFGFNGRLELQYRGRLDASRRDPAPPGARREMFEAMKLIAATGKGPAEQLPSIGCSIKWRAAVH